MNRVAGPIASSVLALHVIVAAAAPPPTHVDITWFSMANVYYQFSGLGVLTDGYVTRLPQSAFFGGASGLAHTRRPLQPEVAMVERVLAALGGPSSVDLLLTGHSHFDHSFDTATWSRLTGARILGSQTTCHQAVAQAIPADRCRSVSGGERIVLGDGITLRVVRWNHAGDPGTKSELHDPRELDRVPAPEGRSGGGLRAGVLEDFPNGGGGRAFLFVVDGADGRFSWFYQNSASAMDMHLPVVVGTSSYGAPLDNLKAAMQAEALESVDLWIGTGGLAVARLVVPLIRPKVYLPVHWEGLWSRFEAGVPKPYSDPPLESFLAASNVSLLRPTQYLDKWRLSATGMERVDNAIAQRALGF